MKRRSEEREETRRKHGWSRRNRVFPQPLLSSWPRHPWCGITACPPSSWVHKVNPNISSFPLAPGIICISERVVTRPEKKSSQYRHSTAALVRGDFHPSLNFSNILNPRMLILVFLPHHKHRTPPAHSPQTLHPKPTEQLTRLQPTHISS